MKHSVSLSTGGNEAFGVVINEKAMKHSVSLSTEGNEAFGVVINGKQ